MTRPSAQYIILFEFRTRFKRLSLTPVFYAKASFLTIWQENLAVILAILVSFAFLPQLILIDAYAKGPIRNFEHEMGQYARLLIIPMAIAIVLLGLWRIRTRQELQFASK